MSMTADLRDRLVEAGVAGGRVHRDLRPQASALPSVTLQLISEPTDALMKGENSLRASRVQVDCWSASRGEADAIADAVRAARPEREVIGSTDFRRAYVDDVSSRIDTADGRESTPQGTIFRTRIDLIIWWRPA